MPIDTCKTVLQVDGARGFKSLVSRVRDGDVSALYTGALATIAATIVSHYPWFTVHNILDKYLINRLDTIGLLLRSAFIGFCASAVADTISNSIRVVKTVKQASVGEYMSYKSVILKVHAESGLKGLFGRGLLTRILTNGLQSMLFTVIWKFMSRKNTVEVEDSAPARIKIVMKSYPIRGNNTHHLRHAQH
jgi:Mitochondrial carrier protein